MRVYYLKKFVLTLFLFLCMTIAVLAYGPEGDGVYRGYISVSETNTSEESCQNALQAMGRWFYSRPYSV